MLRAVLLVMGGTLASRVLGLVRQAVFNALYPDALKDAFNVAYRVPNLLRELLAEGAVQNALIPLLKSLPPEEAQAFARRFAAFLFGVNLLVLGLGYLLAPWVAGLLVAEESHLRAPEAFQEVVYLTRLLLPFLLGISMAALFSALLQAEERFLPYALGPVAFNLVAILLMALYPGDPTALGLSVSLGGLIQALVQLPFLRGFRLEWRWHPAFLPALLRMGPFAFTTSLRQFLNLVLTNILTRYPPAAVTGFYNAEVVFQMVLGLFATSPAIALFPRMSTLRGEDLGRFLRGPFERLALVLALLGGLLTGLAPFVVVLLFGLFGPLTPENRAYSAEVLRLGARRPPLGGEHPLPPRALRPRPGAGGGHGQRPRLPPEHPGLLAFAGRRAFPPQPLHGPGGLGGAFPLPGPSAAGGGWGGVRPWIPSPRPPGGAFGGAPRVGPRERLPRLLAQGGAASPPPGRGRGGGPLPLRRGFAGPTRKGALERRAGAL